MDKNNILTPCKNTAKMLGASGIDALNFGDACFGLVNYLNPELKAKSRKIILKTVLYGKPMEDWLLDMFKIAKEEQRKEKVQKHLMYEVGDSNP